MANLWQPSINRALDRDGNPASGAKLFVYRTNSVINELFYLDDEGLVPGSNPVIANSEGILPAIYLDSELFYRMVLLTNSGSETIYDVDPVRGFDETSIASSVDQINEVSSEVTEALETINAGVESVDQSLLEITDLTTRTETAAAAASADSNVYVDEATGRAAVADGETFLTENPDDSYADLYRRIDANNSEFIATLTSKSDFDELLAIANDARDEATALRNTAQQGIDLANTAITGYNEVYRTIGIGNASATYRGWAKGFLAHETLNDDSHIKAGQTVGIVYLEFTTPSAGSQLEVKIIERDADETGAPETLADDVVLYDSGLMSYDDLGIFLHGTGRAVWSVPVTPFTVSGGKKYIIVYHIRDNANNFVAAGAGFKNLTAAVNQDLAGYWFNGSIWSNQTANRPFAVGFGSPIYQNINDIEVSNNETLLRDTEKLFLGRFPWGKWKYTGTSTTAFEGREGLANIFGETIWSAGPNRGVVGVDFGHVTSPDLMTNFEDTPLFSGSLLRIQDNTSFNAVGGYRFEKHKMTNGQILYNTNRPAPLHLEDCSLLGQTVNPNNNGITQATTLQEPGKITMKNCTVKGYALAQLNVCHGDFINCDLQFSAADIVIGGWGNNQSPDFSRPLYFERNLMRLPANNQHPSFGAQAHADIWQVNNPYGLSVVGNTLYMPSTDSGYDEGSIGTTSAFANGSIRDTNETFYLGNVLVGGAFSVFLGLAAIADSSIKNVAFVNNIFGTGGRLGDPVITDGPENYNSFGDFNIANTAPRTTGSWANIMFWGNRGADGYPVRVAGGAMPVGGIRQQAIDAGNAALETNESGVPTGQFIKVNGIFNYDKTQLTDRMRELILTLAKEHDVEIIDPVTFDINPEYDLGNLTAD